LRRRHRDESGLFLAEGPQAVREALAAGAATELFGTLDGYGRARDLVEADYLGLKQARFVVDVQLSPHRTH